MISFESLKQRVQRNPFLDLEDDGKDGSVLNMRENTKAFAGTTRNKAPGAHELEGGAQLFLQGDGQWLLVLRGRGQTLAEYCIRKDKVQVGLLFSSFGCVTPWGL